MNPRSLESIKAYLLPTALCIGLAFALGQTSWLQHLENLTQDQVTRFRVRFQPLPDDRVMIVGIDDHSINELGRWPWDRTIHGQFMQAIALGKPAVVAWDILFVDPAAGDDGFKVGAAKLNGRVVFGAYSTDEDLPQPPSLPAANQPLRRISGDASRLPAAPFAMRPIIPLQEVGVSAFCNTTAGPDGIRREMPLLHRVDEQIYPSFALQTLMTYGNLTPKQVRVVLGEAIYLEGETFQRRIPINAAGEYLINYRYGIAGSNSISYYPLAEGYKRQFIEHDPQAGLPSVTQKILLVGLFSTGLTDNGVTPFEPDSPLVLTQANTIDNILREDFARRLPEGIVLLATLIISLVSVAYWPKRALRLQALGALFLPIIYIGIAALLWIRWSLWTPLWWPLIGFGALQIVMIVRQLLIERRAKQRITGMFGTYVSPEIVNRMVESGKSPELGGHAENITAYFSDIQSFSAFSEKLPPDRLVELMNEYLTACTDIIHAEGGTLDKYIGDGVVAMFGAPLPLPDHALRACVASQRIQVKLTELRAKWKAEGKRWPEIVHEMHSRIGLNSGPVIVGNMGSRTRFNYTMMGDNVNLAARMESGAKNWGVYSMCSDSTRDACIRDGGDRVVFRSLGRILVKGRTTAVPIFEIVGLKETVSASTHECVRIFELALARYYARDWAGALTLFAQSDALEPTSAQSRTTNPSRVYLEIVRRYQIAPPDETWEGEYVMTLK